LPVYEPLAHLITYLVPLRRNSVRKRTNEARRGRLIAPTADLSAPAPVHRVNQHQLPDALTFLQEWNSHYQFAPVYTLQDVLGQTNLLPNFSWENLYLYQENGKVKGT